MTNEIINVLIADDHALIRQGVKSIISLEEDINIVGEADNGAKALELLEIQNPHVAILDVNMPILSGIKVLQILKEKSSSIKVIILTVENDIKLIHEAINLGADGYVLKDSAGTEIVDAIRTVYSGEKYIDKSLVSVLFSDIKSKNENTKNVLDSLTKREIEILLRISKGYSNKEIGNQLYLSEKTVKNYATNLFRKLSAPDRIHAAIIAFNSSIEDYYQTKYSKNQENN